MGLGTGTQTGPPTRGKHRPAGSEVGAPAKPAPRSQKEHPPEAGKSGFSARSWILPCWRLGEGPIGIAQVGCLGQRPFWCSAGSCSERPPSRQFRESLASGAFWVSGILLPELGPWHGYDLGQRSPLGFPDLLPLQCEAPGWGGDARKYHRNLRGGSELGLGTGTPRQDHQPAKNNGLLAARSVLRRSRRLHPEKNTRRWRGKTSFPVRSWILPCWRMGGSDWHRSGRVFGSAAFLVFSGILF